MRHETCHSNSVPWCNSQVPQLGPLTALRRLELSYNGIKSLAPLTALTAPHLSDLYVASNRISSVRLLLNKSRKPSRPRFPSLYDHRRLSQASS